MKIAIGSDHAGFRLKEKIKEFLLSKGYEVLDFGTNSTESTHYPIFAKEWQGQFKERRRTLASLSAEAV
jgi:ribose 5-phosphate isomerase B